MWKLRRVVNRTIDVDQIKAVLLVLKGSLLKKEPGIATTVTYRSIHMKLSIRALVCKLMY